MKVALFVHCFFPSHFYGTEVYTLELAKNLKEMGHEPVIVTGIFPGEPSKEEIVSYYEFEGLPVYCIDKNYFPYKRIKDTYYQPEIRGHIKSLLLEITPDIIHVTHLVNHTAILLEVAEELDFPIMATLTDFFGICYNSQLRMSNGELCQGPNLLRTNCLACRLKDEAAFPGAYWLFRLIGPSLGFIAGALLLRLIFILPWCRKGRIGALVEDIIYRPDILRELYAKYRCVIAPTTFLKDAYVKNGLKSTICKINFGVDIEKYPKKALSDNPLIKFGYIGQIAPHKGTDLLVDAFCQLPKGVACLDIYGDEEQYPEFTSRIKNMAEGYNVSFKKTFPKEKIGEILSGFDFLVIPSIWYENSPLVLLSSLACNTPAIVSDVAGMTEFIKNEKNGFSFKRGSVKDLKETLEKIVADPSIAFSLGEQTEFHRTTKMMSKEVFRIYQEVLKG